jgi:glycosyltransferase
LKITIITASFNNRETIGATIESVLAQDYPNIEYIIIDGASTDGTKELIAEKYLNKVSLFVSQPDDGMYHALNKGIDLATGDVIGFLHADDFYFSHHVIGTVAEKFASGPCHAIYGDLQYVYKNEPEKILRYWKSGEYNIKNMKKGWMPPHPTLFIKQEWYRQHGGFDTSYKVAADYELMTRFLCTHHMQACYVPSVFINMRWGGKSNKSIRNIIIKMADDYRAIRKNKVGNVWTLFMKNFSKISQFFKR